MDNLLREIRFAARALAQQSAFTAVVVLTLALGIGANTAIFSVVDAVLLQPLPYRQPDRLVRVWSAFPADEVEHGTTSPVDLEDWRDQATSFEAIAGYPAITLSGLVITGVDAPDEVRTMHVTEDFFEVFGIDAELGRTLRAADQREDDNRVVVLSHGAWVRRFGADPEVIGTSVTLGGEPFVVVGVMPPDFEYPSADVELWTPVSIIPETGIPRLRPVRWLNVVARLADGVTIELARAEMTAVVQRLANEYPDSNDNLTAATIAPLHEQMVGDVRPAVLAVFVAVGLVLLIGCANIANLVLARAESRHREMAVRVALGAGRARLLAHVLAESLLLSLIGGAVGVIAALIGLRYLVSMAPQEIPRLSAVGVNGVVLAFTLGLSVLAGLAFGMAPALRVNFSRPAGTLREGRGGDGSGGRFRGALVVGEVALVVVLAIGAGLLIRTYRELLAVDPGFATDNVLTLRVSARGDDTYVDFLHQAVEHIRTLPGVEAAGMVRPLPLRADTFQGESFEFRVVGRDAPDDGGLPEAYMRFAGPGYFEAIGIPLLAGRDFRAGDDRESPLVVIVSRAAAERYWDGDNPVGSRIAVGDEEVPVIGMVGDVRQMSLAEEPAPVIYVSHRQVSRTGMTFVVRSAAGPASLIGAIQRAIWELRPDQPIEDIATMDTVVGASVAQPRFAMALLSLFAGLALILAAVGVYGVISYSVGRRRREIGIRIALGARPAQVLRGVVRGSLALAGLGVALGLSGAALTMRLMAGLLYGVPALDPATFGLVGGLLLGISLLASVAPAVRASRVDPSLTMRSE
ncbi:MAG: ABC transporter permease [Acidobacteriota bacterium]|jgi:predicted permease